MTLRRAVGAVGAAGAAGAVGAVGTARSAGAAGAAYTAGVDPETEAKARAIELAARAQRRPLPRGMWIAAVVVSLVCAGGIAIAWIEDRDTASLKPLDHRAIDHGSGLWLGLVLGLALGIAIGSMLALRRR